PAALQPPNLPPAFDGNAAAAVAQQLATAYPIRSAGSAGGRGAATWLASELAPYGYTVHREPFTAVVPGRGRVHGVNLLATTRSAAAAARDSCSTAIRLGRRRRGSSRPCAPRSPARAGSTRPAPAPCASSSTSAFRTAATSRHPS